MHQSFFIVALSALATTINSLQFSINPITAVQRLTPIGFQVNFTVSAPGSLAPEQGGPEPAQCSLTSGYSVNTCWTGCTGGSGQYFARVTPGTSHSAEDFSLDIWQAYVYELGNHNNATIPINTVDAGLACVTTLPPQGGEYITCTSNGTAVNQDYTAYYGGADPDSSELC